MDVNGHKSLIYKRYYYKNLQLNAKDIKTEVLNTDKVSFILLWYKAGFYDLSHTKDSSLNNQ